MKTLLVTLSLFAFGNSFAQNVGIATTNPTAKLHINGTLKITNGSQGEGKVLTSDAAGLATWVSPQKSIFKATGFEYTFSVPPGTTRELTDWKTVEINVDANSIFYFYNAGGDFFVLKNGYYRVSSKVSAYFAGSSDSQFIDLFILINGVRKAVRRLPIPNNNIRAVSISINSIFQLSAQDKISFEFYNSNSSSGEDANFTNTYIGNMYNEFTVEQL